MPTKVRGKPLTPSDRTCLAIMLVTAEAKGWRVVVLKEQNGFIELICLFPPGIGVATHSVVRLSAEIVVLMDGPTASVLGEFLSVMDALGAVSKILDELPIT